MIIFPVAHDSFFGYPVLVLQIRRKAFQQVFLTRDVLWLRCFRVIVDYTNVKTCLTIRRVVFERAKWTSAFVFLDHLNYDLCTLAVNLMFFLVVCATPSCCTLLFGERITSLSRPTRTRFFLSVHVVRSQMRNCYDLCSVSIPTASIRCIIVCRSLSNLTWKQFNLINVIQTKAKFSCAIALMYKN